MKRALVTACTAAAGLLVAATASAQPGNWAPPPEPAPQPAAAAPEVQRWGIGLRTANLEVTSTSDEDNKVELKGAGLHLRYLLAPAWRAELTLEGVSSDDDSLGFTRSSDVVTLGLHYIFNPYASWNWYALAGFGHTSTEITYDTANGAERVEEFGESHVAIGIGLERRFERIGLGAELRALALSRDDGEGDGELYAGVDGPVPYESSAGQLNLHFTYYF